MDRTTRFRVWLLVVAFVLAAPIAAAVIADPEVTALLAFLAGMALLGMFALLVTTPHDAIRLKQATSHAFVFAGGFMLFELWRIAFAETAGQAWSMQRLATPLLILGFLYLARDTLEPKQQERPPVSIWWMATVFWNPVLGVPLALDITWWHFVVLIAALLPFASFQRSVQRRWQEGLPIGAWRWTLSIAAYGAMAIGAGVIARIAT